MPASNTTLGSSMKMAADLQAELLAMEEEEAAKVQ
jgi:hypothetical protein